MKKITTLLIFICLSFTIIHAQRINYVEHCYVPSDSITKQQVTYVDPGAAGKKITWDFSKLQTLTDKYILTYKGDIDSLCGYEHRTHYYYSQDKSGIWCTGFENANTYIQFTDSILELPFPMQYGDKRSSKFKGTGEYGFSLPIKVEGTVSISVDATGTLKLSEYQFDVIRVKQVLDYTKAGTDSSSITKTSYRWYTNGYRYPVFESVRTLIKTESNNDSTVFSTSFLYSSSIKEQKMREVENASEWFSKKDIESAQSMTPVKITDLIIYPNPVHDNTTLSCNVNQNTTVEIRIYSGSGALVYEVSHMANAGANTWTIPTLQLNVGSYFVYVTAINTETTTSTILLRI